MIVHVLSGELSSQEEQKVENEELAISDISLWELAKLVERERLRMEFESPEFRQFLSTVVVIPITMEIAVRSTQLDFSSDPADEIIAATSIVYDVPLLTRDKRIRKSKMVPLA